MGFASLYPSYTPSELPQQSLPRHMIDFEPDPIRVFEQDRIISRRPLILARCTNDVGAERLEEAVQFVDVGAFSRAEAEMMQADASPRRARSAILRGKRAMAKKMTQPAAHVRAIYRPCRT